MAAPVKLISSMATKDILIELAADYASATGKVLHLDSVGGVEAARRIRAGELFDVALLAEPAMRALANEGFIAAGSIRPFALSPTAVAVRAGSARPIGLDEASIKHAIANSRALGVSTGPSGVSIIALLKRWGVYDAMKDRVVQAPPAVPVATLLARGDCDLGFQQLSELMGHDGIEIVGNLADSVIPKTLFAAGTPTTTREQPAKEAVIEFLLSDAATPAKRKFGMQPS